MEKAASVKQIGFLKFLLSSRVHKMLPGNLEDMTMESASNAIQTLLEMPEKPKDTSPKGEVEDGFYRLENDDIVVVKWNREKTGKYAMRLVVSDGVMNWSYERGLIRECEGAMRLTLEEACKFGKLYGRCMVCGRTLTNPESIERGIGPICAERF